MLSIENPLNWTLTHAHYLQMGGYRLQCRLDERDRIPSKFGRQEKVVIAGRERFVWELPLSFEMMKNVFNNQLLVDLPFISRDEILDKNGRDGLSKAIAMLQLTWFVVQIVARVRQSLAVTELELTTAALASLNIVMYVSWWSKPTDILCPTVISTKRLLEQTQTWREASLPSSPLVDTNGVNNLSPSSGVAQSTTPHGITSSTSQGAEDSSNARKRYFITEVGDTKKVNLAAHYCTELKNAFQESLTTITSFPRKFATGLVDFVSEVVKQTRGIWSNTLVANKYPDNHPPSDENPPSGYNPTSNDKAPPSFLNKVMETIILPWRTITHLFLALIYYPILAILDSGKNLTSPGVDLDDSEVDKMANFKLIFNEIKLRSVMDMVFFCENVASAPFLCLSAFSGAIFGAIHCLAWNFKFPSLVEQVLWRTCSSIIAGLCGCIMAISLFYIIIKIIRQRSSIMPQIFGQKFTEIVFSAFAICFVLTRFTLLSLSVIGLRDLPASTFETVQWSGFIPHV